LRNIALGLAGDSMASAVRLPPVHRRKVVSAGPIEDGEVVRHRGGDVVERHRNSLPIQHLGYGRVGQEVAEAKVFLELPIIAVDEVQDVVVVSVFLGSDFQVLGRPNPVAIFAWADRRANLEALCPPPALCAFVCAVRGSKGIGLASLLLAIPAAALHLLAKGIMRTPQTIADLSRIRVARLRIWIKLTVVDAHAGLLLRTPDAMLLLLQTLDGPLC